MRRWTRVWCVPLVFALVGAFEASKSEPVTVELTRRDDKGAQPETYVGCAYSFRLRTADGNVHHNYADLLLNNCGLLHLRVVDDMASRIALVGKGTLDSTPDVPTGDAWTDAPIRPEVGAVYVMEIAVRTERMTVKLRFDEVGPDKVRFTWKTLVPLTGAIDRSRWGYAGQHGMCGPHKPGTESAGPAGSGVAPK